MENQITSKNAGRKPLSVLYTSDINKPAPAPIGKLDGHQIIKDVQQAKSTFVFCDDQNVSVSKSSDHQQPSCVQEKKKSTFIYCDDDHYKDENKRESIAPQVEAEKNRGPVTPAGQDENACVDVEEATKKEKPIFILGCDDQEDADEKDKTENGVVIVDHEMAEKSSSSVLCVSMHSVSNISSNLSLTHVEKEMKRDILYSCRDYAQDIHGYLRQLEVKHRPKWYYMKKQPQVNEQMRSVLVDWLVDVTCEYDLSQETLHMAVSFTDRFLSLMAVRKEHLQLVGTAATMIAAKYEEIYPPDVQEFIYITDDTYSRKEILQMEQILLKTLNFNLSPPTSFAFLMYYLNESRAGQRCQNLAKYLCDLALMDYSFLAYLPSLVAACCTFLAHSMTDGIREAFNGVLADHAASDIDACSNALLALLKSAPAQTQQAIRDKYKGDKYCRVALLEPPETLPSLDRP